MTTPRRPFNRAAFLAGYRAACEAQAVDPATGNPAAWDDPHWWANPGLWTESGRNHSSTEAAALANVAAQARRAAGIRPALLLADLTTADLTTVVREYMHEEYDRRRSADLSLRELHALRGEMVDTILGVRMLVPIKKAS